MIPPFTETILMFTVISILHILKTWELVIIFNIFQINSLTWGTPLKMKICLSDFLSFMSTCNKEIVHEIEVRTKGQHDNSLWISARAARITASNVYEFKTIKEFIKPENIVCKLLYCKNTEG